MLDAVRDAINEEEIVHESFVVDDDRKAEWVLEQIRNRKQEKEKWKAHYDSMYRAVAFECDKDIAKFSSWLEDYLNKQIEAGLAKKTPTQLNYKLPSGKLVRKCQEPEYDLDDAAIIKWLKANSPEFIKVKEEVAWNDLKKTLVVDGDQMVTEYAEVVPGIKVHAREDIFKVEGV